jgi:hypothetical protein
MAKVDGARVAKVAAGRSRFCVESDDPGVDGAEVDATLAGSVGGGARVEPRGHAAIGEITPVAAVIGVGVERPLHLPADRIEGDHTTERCREEHRAVDDEWCRLELGGFPGFFHLAGAIGPRDAERGDIGAGDLRQGREPAAECVVTVRGPIAGRLCAGVARHAKRRAEHGQCGEYGDQ